MTFTTKSDEEPVHLSAYTWAFLREDLEKLHQDIRNVEGHPLWTPLLDSLERLELKVTCEPRECLVIPNPRVPYSIIKRRVHFHPLMGKLLSRLLRLFLESGEFATICRRFGYSGGDVPGHFGLEQIGPWFMLWFEHHYGNFWIGQLFLGGAAYLYTSLGKLPYMQVVAYLPRFVLYRLGDLNQDGEGRSWIDLLARGRNIRKARHLPFPLTKRMAHWFTQAPDHFDFSEALLYGEVRAMGGSYALYESLQAFYQNNLEDHISRREIIRFLVRHEESIDHQMLVPLLGYLDHRHLEEENFRLTGRSPAAIQRQMRAWYEEQEREGMQPYYSNRGAWNSLHRRRNRTLSTIQYQPSAPQSWPGTDYQEFLLEKEHIAYRIVQLKTRGELVEEGAALHHCVASYTRGCIEGRHSIWSLRLYTSGQEMARMATILVDEGGQIMQVRGNYNAQPEPEAKELILEWAEKARLEVKRF